VRWQPTPHSLHSCIPTFLHSKSLGSWNVIAKLLNSLFLFTFTDKEQETSKVGHSSTTTITSAQSHTNNNSKKANNCYYCSLLRE
jgi:hypothetical protein